MEVIGLRLCLACFRARTHRLTHTHTKTHSHTRNIGAGPQYIARTNTHTHTQVLKDMLMILLRANTQIHTQVSWRHTHLPPKTAAVKLATQSVQLGTPERRGWRGYGEGGRERKQPEKLIHLVIPAV